MIEFTRRTSRNVKRWQSGDMCLRWTAAGMLEAERQFRKIIGYSTLATLANAVERDLAAHRATPPITTREETARSPPPEIIHRDRRHEVPRRRDNLGAWVSSAWT